MFLHENSQGILQPWQEWGNNLVVLNMGNSESECNSAGRQGWLEWGNSKHRYCKNELLKFQLRTKSDGFCSSSVLELLIQALGRFTKTTPLCFPLQSPSSCFVHENKPCIFILKKIKCAIQQQEHIFIKLCNCRI